MKVTTFDDSSIFATQNQNKMKKNNVLLLPILALVIIARYGSGCSKATVDTVSVNVVNTCPNSPSLYVWANGSKVVNNAISFPNNTGYQSLNAGNMHLILRSAKDNSTVLDTLPTLPKGGSYMLFAINKLDSVKLFIVQDSSARTNSGKANVRLIHLSPNVGGIDVVDSATGVVWFQNFYYQQITLIKRFPAGKHTLLLRSHGTVVNFAVVRDVTFTALKSYTLVPTGLLAGTGSQALGLQVIPNF